MRGACFVAVVGAVAVAGALGTALAGSAGGQGQPPASTPLAFDVASVKQNKSGSGMVQMMGGPGGGLTVTNAPLRLLIRNAYQLQDFQLVGGASWIGSDRFDIVAKGSADASVPNLPGQPGPAALMLRALLADRFKLKVHTEARELPVFALVLARSDGRLGPQLHPSTTDCAAVRAAARGAPPALPTPGERMMCGVRMAPGQMSGGGNPLSQLATTLSQWVQRTVVDRTGLTGNYDFDLTWTPDQLPQGPPSPGAPTLPPIDPNGPSIFTAVQEQLGLKLDAQKGPVDVLVIDRVEHPTED